MSNAYACLPKFDKAQLATGGLEFTITVRGSVPSDSSLVKAQDQVLVGIKEAVQALLDGKLV